MALIKCPECGNQVSDKATACPNCGCPIGSIGTAQEQMYEDEFPKKKWWIWPLAVTILCVISGVGYYSYKLLQQGNVESLNDGTIVEGKKESIGIKEDLVELTPEFINSIRQYDGLGVFNEGYAAVYKGHKKGYINTKGEEVIPVTIDADCVGMFSEGLAIVIPNSSEDFYVIDTKGKTVFKGKDLHGIWDILCIPYFIDGKLYVPTDDNGFKYRIYDKQGNIIGIVDQEVGDNYYNNHQIGDYTLFSMTHDRYDETDSYQRDETYGLKDISGKIVIDADYDLIQNKKEGSIRISNDVVLVALTEYDENYDGGEDEHTRYHYGYADLKGNDTFTAEQKRRWRQSKIAAMQKNDEESTGTNEYDSSIASDEYYDTDRSSSSAPQWVQGTWKHDLTAPMVGIVASYTLEVSGNTMTFYRNGEMQYRDNFTYQNGRLVGQHGSFILNENAQRLADETGRYDKVDAGGSNGSGIRFSTAYDVIGYLSGRTFRDIDGGGSLQIRQDGVYVNGQCKTGAPRVIRFSSTNAIVQASIVPSGSITFHVDAQSGTINDSMGNTYR